MVRSFLLFTVLLCLLLPLIDCGSSRKLTPASSYDLVPEMNKAKSWTKPEKSTEMSPIDSAFTPNNDSIQTSGGSSIAKIDSLKKE
jgi:hypothetical protein